MREWSCNKIFLATEDINFVKIFKNVFGDNCLTVDKEYINYDGKNWISNYHTNRANDYYLRGKEYLTEMAIASKCNSFITARCSGSVGVMMMANFENVYAFNLGRYNTISMDGFEDD